MIRNLAAKGLIAPDALQLGIDAEAATGAVKNINGEISNSMFTLGGNLKGILWETNAVPELRVQAQGLARTILQKTGID